MSTFTESVTLTTIHCGQCGSTYAINEHFRAHKAQEGGSWNCPYCQVGWGYSDNNENARLKKELEQAQTQLRTAKCETLSEKMAREKAEKRLRRVKNGVCPCCNRTFTNLARHIASKHKGKIA